MKTTFIATGDSFITRHIGEYGYDGYEDVCDLIDRHEVRFANLEMTFHNQEGYPAAASGGTWAMTEPEMLDDMHKRKIDMADEIYVIDVGGYIGESTQSEIEYAEATGKRVNYLEGMNLR